MRSVRLEAALERRIGLAAAQEGISVSEFIRRAAAERADIALAGPTNAELLADVIGVAPSNLDDGGVAHRVKDAYREELDEKYSPVDR
jgi:hypothetical protein